MGMSPLAPLPEFRLEAVRGVLIVLAHATLLYVWFPQDNPFILQLIAHSTAFSTIIHYTC